MNRAEVDRVIAARKGGKHVPGGLSRACFDERCGECSVMIVPAAVCGCRCHRGWRERSHVWLFARPGDGGA